ncbi:MAG TPA: hypothetical protein PLC04_05230 [Candidatus Kapabacteria bacterium]|jgi:hypothetical protein|nr:hypothetical protein [Candidatus Kapabacteria bacterium]HOV92463.1 hypothetical protein [Candidatus Kapabacteria bacterium]
MQNIEYSSDKKILSSLGFIIIGFVLIYLIVSIQSNVNVEKITHFSILGGIFILLGILLIFIGKQKRKFVFSENTLSFYNRKRIVFQSDYADIDLIRIFHNNPSNEITLGIVKSDNSTFSITNSFFSNEMLYKVILKLKEIADAHNIGFENEIEGLTL